MNHKVLLAAFCAVSLLGGVQAASAHEFILKPEKSVLAAAEPVQVQVQASHVFMISEEAEPLDTVELVLLQNHKKLSVQLEEDGALHALVGQIVLPSAGPALLVGHRLPQVWSDTTEGVLAGDRDALEKMGKTVLEVGKYEKFAKTLLNPAANDSLYKKVLGQELEIVLLTNPASLKSGGTVKARVLLHGKPVKALVGITYDGISTSEDQYAAKKESSADGMVELPVDRAGLWMLRAEYTEKLNNDSADKHNMRCTYVFPVSR